MGSLFYQGSEIDETPEGTEKSCVVLFGEAEYGQFVKPQYCDQLDQLLESFGHPPKDSLGLHFAVQAIMYNRGCLFFRVGEEGYSLEDYYEGLKALKPQQELSFRAVFMPGLSDPKLIKYTQKLCYSLESVFLIREPDFYDWMTG